MTSSVDRLLARWAEALRGARLKSGRSPYVFCRQFADGSGTIRVTDDLTSHGCRLLEWFSPAEREQRVAERLTGTVTAPVEFANLGSLADWLADQ